MSLPILLRPDLSQRSTPSAATTVLDTDGSVAFDSSLRIAVDPQSVNEAQIKVALAEADDFDSVRVSMSNITGSDLSELDLADISFLWDKVRLSSEEKEALMRLGKEAQKAGFYGAEELDEALVAEGFGVPALGALALVVVVAVALWVV